MIEVQKVQICHLWELGLIMGWAVSGLDRVVRLGRGSSFLWVIFGLGRVESCFLSWFG
jgi:hypothetical protein